jgi:hypothetical protein
VIITKFRKTVLTDSANDEKNLRIRERKVLRKIFGPICAAGNWRRRTNEEVKQ